ncbi:jg21979, partial [Pararge aegeria aegeria]
PVVQLAPVLERDQVLLAPVARAVHVAHPVGYTAPVVQLAPVLERDQVLLAPVARAVHVAHPVGAVGVVGVDHVRPLAVAIVQLYKRYVRNLQEGFYLV